ncbi:MAG: hypothetical protein JO140_02135, partial [Candidatus Eremiobacteraeota bacterium]|nr:hypothetical protein [Candidatus Eremiobacteraeota bacterium]
PVPDLTGSDPRIHILITDVLAQNGEGGYFYSGNLFSQGVLNCTAIPRPVSNELPMVVIGGDRNRPAPNVPLHNPQYWLTTDMPRALSHELQHYLHNVNKYYTPLATGTQTALDAPWIDEGCSMLAEDLAANGMAIDTPAYAYLYLLEPSQYSLTSFVGNQPNPVLGSGPYALAYYTPGNYGAAYLFVRYLYDRFGPSALHAIYSDFRVGPVAGATNVNPILAAAGNEPWPQLYGEWAIAVAAQSSGLTSDPRYAFAPSLVLRGQVRLPSRRLPPLDVRTFTFAGPQPPEAFDPSGNLLGYVTVSTSSSASIRALDGAVNFFNAVPAPNGAMLRASVGTLTAPQGALLQGTFPTPQPTNF